MEKGSKRIRFELDELIKLGNFDEKVCVVPKMFLQVDIMFRKPCLSEDCVFKKYSASKSSEVQQKENKSHNFCPIHGNRKAPLDTNPINAPHYISQTSPIISATNIEEINSFVIQKEKEEVPVLEKIKQNTKLYDESIAQKNLSFEQFVRKLNERQKELSENTSSLEAFVSNEKTSINDILNHDSIQATTEKIQESKPEMIINNSHLNGVSDQVHVIDPSCPIHSRQSHRCQPKSFVPSCVEKRLYQKNFRPIGLDNYTDPWKSMRHKSHTQFFETSAQLNQQPISFSIPSTETHRSRIVNYEDYSRYPQGVYEVDNKKNSFGLNSTAAKDPNFMMILRKLGNKKLNYDSSRNCHAQNVNNSFSHNHSFHHPSDRSLPQPFQCKTFID